MIKKFKKGSRTKLSENFNSSEFDCKCQNASCKETPIDMDLIQALEIIRKDLNMPMFLTSGYRCQAHNAQIGGAQKSNHMLGQACDFVVKGMTIQQAYERVDKLFPNSMGVLLEYQTWIHCDIRPTKYREVVK